MTYRCLAERSLLNALEGGCQIAMGVRSSMTDHSLRLYSIVLASDGQDFLECSVERRCTCEDDAVSIGRALAQQMQEKGAERIIGKPGRREITYGSMEKPSR